MSQRVAALHIGGAFSCLEIVDFIYRELMRPHDVFILSKGHGALAQYAVLEGFGIVSLDDYGGRLGVHPDRETPGIEASTGSLGHGLGIAAGIAYAERELRGSDARVMVLISDGELMEGSTWEAMLLAANLGLANLAVFVDYNDQISCGSISFRFPWLEPIQDKASAFGFHAQRVNGHDVEQLRDACPGKATVPSMLICDTVKGKGVSFMERAPMWHYRSPSRDEYVAAIDGLVEVER